MELPRGPAVVGHVLRSTAKRSTRGPEATPRSGVRPGLWLVAGVFFAAAAYVVVQVVQYDPVAGARAAAEEARAARPASSRPSRWQEDEDRSPSHGSSAGGTYRHHDWGVESELSRRMALGLPLDGFWRQPPQHDLERDPQLFAMWRSFHWQRDADAEAPPLPFEPTGHRAELLEAEGDVAASPNSCEVRVLPVESAPFNCVVRVTCDGAVLYPNERQDAGYVPCEIENGRPVRAVDSGQTDRDGDPLVDLDLDRGTITVEDFAPDGTRRYRATLRIHG